jgi:cellulose synthase/poly-beta-1,6-N-acetylglucosamine synthase-like glycosyltransferase
LESLENCDLPADWASEVVVVDNGSSDGTSAALARFCQNNRKRQFRYLCEPKEGKAFALNTGIAGAKGWIIAFTDDDVVVDKGWLREITQQFEKRPELGLIAGRVELASPRNLPVALTKFFTEVTLNPAQSLEGLVFGCNLAARREVLDRVRGFDVRLGPGRQLVCEDIDLAYRVVRSGFPGIFSPLPVVNHVPGARLRGIENLRGWGAFYTKYILRGDRYVARQAWWEACRIWSNLRQGGNATPRPAFNEAWQLAAGGAVMIGRLLASLFRN